MKLVPILLSAFCVSLKCMAQVPFNTRDSLDVNHINASVLLHGDMWWDPATSTVACFYPANSSKTLGGTGSIWMSGYDGSGNLHVSAQTYRTYGNDFWPGPPDATGALTYAASTNWAKFFRVSQADIQIFQAMSSHTMANTPPSIFTWPAAGNANAIGNGGIPLSIPASATMAPFVDANGNGIYEPLLGEYPDIRGDQALWWTLSDNGPAHNSSNGLPLGVEVHVLNYGYARNTLIDNVVYYEYTVINHSPNTYNNFRFGLMADLDIGYYEDDYIGFDSAHRAGITYQARLIDSAPPGAPSWASHTYGHNAPVAGVTLVHLPGDTDTYKVPAGCFNYFSNGGSTVGPPYADTQFNNLMRSRSASGHHRYNGYTGPGGGWNTSGPYVDYVFPGDPSNSPQWSECAQNNGSGNRLFILSSGDMTLAPGGSLKITMALIVTDTNQGGCPNVSFHDINIVADTAWAVYHNPPPPIPVGISNVNAAPHISVHPNPASSMLTAQLSANASNTGLQVLNSVGQIMPVVFSISGTEATADISLLPPGIYQLRCIRDACLSVARFVKQ